MDVRESVIEKRLSKIKRIICIASGKGGVGKSLIASTLALKLENKGHKVGLLDLDLYGPSSHIILGFKKKGFPREDKGIIPSKVSNIKFMSIVYFSDDKPSPFRGLDISICYLPIELTGRMSEFQILDIRHHTIMLSLYGGVLTYKAHHLSSPCRL